MFGKLKAHEGGMVAVETAILTPFLLVLALGVYDVGSLVARQHTLQSAATEAEIIALAAGAGATTTPQKMRQVLRASLDLDEAKVQVRPRFRCNSAEELHETSEACGTDDTVSRYVEVDIRDTYEPFFAGFGIADDIELGVNRMVMVP